MDIEIEQQAHNLLITLDFCKRLCRQISCDDCYFYDGKNCMLNNEPHGWDTYKVALNIGERIKDMKGDKTNERAENIQE